MKASKPVAKVSTMALRSRRHGVAVHLPPVEQILRGSLVERYVTCGNPGCKCARGERHGPTWYLTVTLGPGRTTGAVVPTEQVEQVRRWIDNFRRMKEGLESISTINRELLRRERRNSRKSSQRQEKEG